MTTEKAIEMCKSIKHYLTGGNPVWSKEEVAEAMTMAIVALEEQPRPIDPTVEVDLASGAVPRSALNRVTNPPKVTIHVDRPKGHWIFDTEDGYYKCSECGSLAEIDSVTNNYWRSNFCPQCGADMRPKLIGKHADVNIIDEACMKGADDE